MECEEKRKTLVSVICEYERACMKEQILQIRDAPFNTHSIYGSTRGKLTLPLTKHLLCNAHTMPRVSDQVTITHDSEKHNKKKGEGWTYLENFNSSCNCIAMPDKVTRTDDTESP